MKLYCGAEEFTAEKCAGIAGLAKVAIGRGMDTLTLL